MAAFYASGHGSLLQGAILFAAYPTKALDDDLLLFSIYGSEDGVLNRSNLSKGRRYAPDRYLEFVIEGVNHAQFGSYGKQKGDGEALISPEDQREQTVSCIVQNMG